MTPSILKLAERAEKLFWNASQWRLAQKSQLRPLRLNNKGKRQKVAPLYYGPLYQLQFNVIRFYFTLFFFSQIGHKVVHYFIGTIYSIIQMCLQLVHHRHPIKVVQNLWHPQHWCGLKPFNNRRIWISQLYVNSVQRCGN